jgi:hypothetical protein
MLSVFTSLAVVGCAGGMGDGCCGWSGKEITGLGQVKKVGLESNLVCPDYYQVDIALGIMRNGFGCMSTHDQRFFVPDSIQRFFIPDSMLKDFRTAAEKSSIVNFSYDVRRASSCVNNYRITSFKVVD